MKHVQKYSTYPGSKSCGGHVFGPPIWILSHFVPPSLSRYGESRFGGSQISNRFHPLFFSSRVWEGEEGGTENRCRRPGVAAEDQDLHHLSSLPRFELIKAVVLGKILSPSIDRL